MYFLLTDSSDKMPFQAMMNEYVITASTHWCLGPWWVQIEEEGRQLSCGLLRSVVW